MAETNSAALDSLVALNQKTIDKMRFWYGGSLDTTSWRGSFSRPRFYSPTA